MDEKRVEAAAKALSDKPNWQSVWSDLSEDARDLYRADAQRALAAADAVEAQDRPFGPEEGDPAKRLVERLMSFGGIDKRHRVGDHEEGSFWVDRDDVLRLLDEEFPALEAADAVQDRLCERCHGDGQIHVAGPTSSTCPTCDGSGRDAVQEEDRPPHGSEGCTCDAEGEDIWCRFHGANAAIRRLERERDRMYQRALDAESHAAFGPMDVDERVRLLRTLVDNVTDERDEARARVAELEAALRRVQDLLDADPDGDRASDALWVVEQALSAAGETGNQD